MAWTNIMFIYMRLLLLSLENKNGMQKQLNWLMAEILYISPGWNKDNKVYVILLKHNKQPFNSMTLNQIGNGLTLLKLHSTRHGMHHNIHYNFILMMTNNNNPNSASKCLVFNIVTCRFTSIPIEHLVIYSNFVYSKKHVYLPV